MNSRLARFAVAVLVLYAIVRIAPTVAGMRALMFGSLYFLGAVVAVSMAVSLSEYVTIDLGKKWHAQLYDACGLLDFNGEPCMLPDGHRSREHATAWKEASGSTECRHRFDDVAAEGRTEFRYARGQLPKVSRTGDVPVPASKS